MQVHQIRGNTLGLMEGLGPLAKYIKAHKANRQLDKSKYASEVNIRPGHNINHRKFLHEGTIEALLKYSEPVDVNDAYNDLKSLAHMTGYNFENNVRVGPTGLKVLDGEWKLMDMGSYHYNRNEKTDDVFLTIIQPGDLKPGERKKVQEISDMVYEKNSNVDRMPWLTIKKSFPGFDESQILEFYREVLGFETNYSRWYDTKMYIDARVENNPDDQILVSYVFKPFL